MEAWIPLFNLFLSSPTPESEASLWFQQSFNASSTPTITTNSFISLLSKPSEAVITSASSPASSPTSDFKRVMWMETLPNMVQARILSFLAYDHRRFSSQDLSRLAVNVLSGEREVDFWVQKAARNLLDILSKSSQDLKYGLTAAFGYGVTDNEFYSVPDWLKDEGVEVGQGLILPWLPLSLDESSFEIPPDNEGTSMEVADSEDEGEKLERNVNEVQEHRDNVGCLLASLDPEVETAAVSLSSQLLNFESSSKIVALANEIRELCHERSRDSFVILALVKPWKAEDETIAVLLSHLSNGNERDELAWPSQVLCSTVLPKLLVLEKPASRILVTATMEYCKRHQRAAEFALLLPLFLRKDGINNPVCDVITRIIKECLHTAHIAALCHKLLCGADDTKRYMWQPCHQSLLSAQLVWTEPLFNLFQNVLNYNVHLTQDSVNHLVLQVRALAERFSKSLKFGNFFLCFVTKCSSSLKPHKSSLIEAAVCTNTIVTKSILSKLASV